MIAGTIEASAITVGDEVIYPADNPISGFVSRVIAIDGDEATCQPANSARPQDAFRCSARRLRLNSTEGS